MQKTERLKESEPLKGFEPIFDKDSRVLILGSFPSVISRVESFYYANPRNRFWSVLSKIFGETVGLTPQEKTAFLLKNKIALWDIAAVCKVEGSADSSISEVKTVDLNVILSVARIEKILLNGKKAYDLYMKKYKNLAINAVLMPSTSPANAASRDLQLSELWGLEFTYLFQ